MSMEHIRRRYGVPAKRGARVIYTKSDGSKVERRIQSCCYRNGYLRIKFEEGDLKPGLFHPTWNLEYLPD